MLVTKDKRAAHNRSEYDFYHSINISENKMQKGEIPRPPKAIVIAQLRDKCVRIHPSLHSLRTYSGNINRANGRETRGNRSVDKIFQGKSNT